MTKQFDVIVVGAGPAGAAAALTAAQGGARVALLERGLYPGAKNASGAGLYDTKMLERVIPGFHKEAPIQRYVTRKMLGFITPEQMMSISYQDERKSQAPYSGYTVLRPELDRYLAQKAVDAGATLLTETVATDVIQENHQVTGVICNGTEKLAAQVVIACDGVNSFLAKKLGMQKPFQPEQMSLGMKEVIRLPKAVIEERFQLKGDEGVAFELVGSASRNVNGGGFLYTNRDSLSIGIVAQLESLQRTGHKPYDMLEEFKGHPAIAPMLKGGVVQEYAAHLIPEGGYDCFSKFSGNGVLVAGDAAGLVLVTGYLLLGINFAIESGGLAGQIAVKALKKNDCSAESLKLYDVGLKNIGILDTFKRFRKAPANAVNNYNLQNVYPDLICSIMHNLYDVENKPLQKVLPMVMHTLKEEELSKGKLVKDVAKIGGALLW